MPMPVLSVVTPPAALISTADAKQHLRVDTSDDDALIDGFVAAATQAIDGQDGIGRSLGQQTLALTAPCFPLWGGDVDWRFGFPGWPVCHVKEMRLPCPPVQSVTSVVYLDPTGNVVTLDPATYALNDRVLFPLGGVGWPEASWRPGAVTVTYVAGYAAGALPAPIRAAILLMVGDLYANRNDAAAVVSLASERLLSPYRLRT